MGTGEREPATRPERAEAWRRMAGAAVLAMLCLSCRAAVEPPARTPATGGSGIGELPASYEGELPGAGGPVRWHVDLLPEGRYRLRTEYVGRPAPNRFDDIGRWALDPAGRLVLRGGREAPVFLLPVDGGTALRKLDLEGQPIESAHNDRLERLPAPRLIEPRLLLTGMFAYMADAPLITLCVDGQRLPVAMEGDYRALERAYLKTRKEPGEPVLAQVEGSIAERPSMEETQPPRPNLVVERFLGLYPRETCGSPLADSPLRGTYWKLVRLGDASVTVAARQREPHIVLATDADRVSGSGGCNRLTATFTLAGGRLKFGRVATTRMACPDGMEEERRFVGALERVEGYRIRGSHLELLDGAGVVQARFEAVARE